MCYNILFIRQMKNKNILLMAIFHVFLMGLKVEEDFPAYLQYNGIINIPILEVWSRRTNRICLYTYSIKINVRNMMQVHTKWGISVMCDNILFVLQIERKRSTNGPISFFCNWF